MSLGTKLRNSIWVRFADKAKEPVKQWCEANSSRNAFDPKVLEYPETKVLAAENGKVINYMPVQCVAMLESIGPNPEATVMEVAEGLVECVKSAATLAHGAGFGELMFLVSDENTALGAKYLGFEELPYKVYRKRLR